MDDPLFLARLQFALTAGTHFTFVALTLGLVTLTVLLQTRATLTRSAVHARMVRYWGQLYVINYAVGIVTGLVMEFQFGMNWSGLARVTGDVFGAPLAMETIGAFFVESTFLGLWIFGWDRFNRWVHLALLWVVALTAYVSAFFILVTNGWLQRPVGYVMENGRMRLTDFGALLGNPTALLAFGHVLAGALLTAGLFMAGVAAFQLRRRTADTEFFRRSLRIGMLTVLVAIIPSAAFGGTQMEYLQPEKKPPLVTPLAQGAESVMTVCWTLMFTLCFAFLVKFAFTRWLERGRIFHVVVMAAVPLPYLAMLSGWIFREAGRQPWAVYGVLRTEDAVSPLSLGAAQLSFFSFVGVFAVLLVVNFWLLLRTARHGPDAVPLGAPAPTPVPVPVPTF